MCERRTAFFRNDRSSYKREQQSYESERECEGRVRHDIGSDVVHSGTKLNLENSCEARNGDEGTTSSHVNLERKICRSDLVRSELNSRFEFRCGIRDHTVMTIFCDLNILGVQVKEG